MVKNYLTETDLQRLVPELANDVYLWTGQTDHSAQGVEAFNYVRQDLINKGYNLRQLMIPLTLSTTGVEDTINRLRWAVTTTVTGTAIIYGSADNSTWNTIQTETISATGVTSYLLNDAYKYYKVGGSATFTSELVDITFDGLIKYKWIEFIMINAGKGGDSKYTEYALYFSKMYDDLLNKMQIPVDTDADGEVDETKSSVIDRTN